MTRQRLRQFLIHPVTLTCAITLLVFISAAIIILFYVFPRLFAVTADFLISQPYILVGNQAQAEIESYIGATLSDGSDFYFYHTQSPGESQSQMRFSILPGRLNQILASTSNLCFGAELTPNATVYFATPEPLLIIKSSQSTSDLATQEPTAIASTSQPTLDFSWMTPLPGHSYAGKNCSKVPAVYYHIRVDESDAKLWTVWIQGYAG